MSEIYTSGTWTPFPGREDAFVEAWQAFADWAAAMPGAGVLTLTRDVGEPHRFVSFGGWDTAAAARDWKADPGFRERIAQVLQHVDGFGSAELAVVATAGTTAAVAVR